MKDKYLISGQLDYIMGYLRYGHYEVEVDRKIWDSMGEDEKHDYLREMGELIIDDVSVEGIGDIISIDEEEI